MSVQEYLKEMREIQEKLLDYLDNEGDFQNLIDKFDEINIRSDQHKLKTLFYLLLKISNNHHRTSNLFDKIEQILQLFKDEMTKYFSNSDIFNIFKSNKKLLLFLIENNIMTVDEYIARKIIDFKYQKQKYPQYFMPEIKPYVNEKWFPKYNNIKHQEIKYEEEEEEYVQEENPWVEKIMMEIPEDFYEKRKKGEDEKYICQLIKNDNINEFVIYTNKNCISLDSFIPISIFETNPYLAKQGEILIIEYAAFFGANQIFNYLRFNGVELDSHLWFPAIYGKNATIIHILEENQIFVTDDIFLLCLQESIKCHHNDIFDYIQNNYSTNEIDDSEYILAFGLKYYNFSIILSEKCDLINISAFANFCAYDYYILVKNFLKEIDDNVNNIIIYTKKN